MKGTHKTVLYDTKSCEPGFWMINKPSGEYIDNQIILACTTSLPKLLLREAPGCMFYHKGPLVILENNWFSCVGDVRFSVLVTQSLGIVAFICWIILYAIEVFKMKLNGQEINSTAIKRFHRPRKQFFVSDTAIRYI